LCVVIHEKGQEIPLARNIYRLLTALLRYPGRILGYWEIARELIPEFNDPMYQGWGDLDPQQQAATKRVLQATVYRTRRALGERPDTPPILLNRSGIGYGIRPWLPPLPSPSDR
jgi:DNA-binding response OmpR family regulator